ncbi:MAG: PfkB family carbohydrate kinase [Candidatus Aceula meridiana]|nr:PfkB family carbohydrate kinase [Candidatus Aceula meridiana]
MSLFVSGTVALDNLKTPSGVRKKMLGGSASHFCMSASLFEDVHLAGIVGKDFLAKHLQLLKNKGVNLSSLQRTNGKTFEWSGEYKNGNFNEALTLKTQLGVLEGYEPKIADSQKKISNVFLANDDPIIQNKVLNQIKKPRLVGLDSMNLWINIRKKLLLSLIKKVDLFVANDGEARMLTKENNLIKAAKALRRLGPKLIVVKKGEHGVLFYSDDLMFSFPAYPVEKVLDPTGAGDTFAGGLMGCLAQSKRLNKEALKQAVLYASVLASFNVEGFGVEKTSRLTAPMVNKRMKEFLKFMHPIVC